MPIYKIIFYVYAYWHSNQRITKLKVDGKTPQNNERKMTMNKYLENVRNEIHEYMIDGYIDEDPANNDMMTYQDDQVIKAALEKAQNMLTQKAIESIGLEQIKLVAYQQLINYAADYMDESKKKNADDPVVLLALYRMAKMLFEQGETIPENNAAIDRYLTGNIIATHNLKIVPLVAEKVAQDSIDTDDLTELYQEEDFYPEGTYEDEEE